MSVLTPRQQLCLDERLRIFPHGTAANTDLTGAVDFKFLDEARLEPILPRRSKLYIGPDEEHSWRINDPASVELELIRSFLDRMPPMAIDFMVEKLLGRLAHTMSGKDLAARTNNLRLPALTLNLQAADFDPTRASFHDDRGIGSTREGATYVQMHPENHRAPDAYFGATREIAELVLSQPYPSIRTAITSEGVRLGLSDGLIKGKYGDVLGRLGRALNESDLRLAVSIDPMDSNFEIARIVESTPGFMGFVVVEHRTGGPSVYLAANLGTHSLIADIGTVAAGVLPRVPTGIHLAPLGAGLSLDDVLRELGVVGLTPGFGAGAKAGPTPTWDVVKPVGVRSQGDIHLIGPSGLQPKPWVTGLFDLAADLGVPVIAPWVGKNGGTPRPSAIQQAELLLMQYGMQHRADSGTPPAIVVTNASLGPRMLKLLKDFGVPMLVTMTEGMGNPFVLHDGTSVVAPPFGDRLSKKALDAAKNLVIEPAMKLPALDEALVNALRNGPHTLDAYLAEHPTEVKPLLAKVEEINAKVADPWLRQFDALKADIDVATLSGPAIDPADDLTSGMGSLRTLQGVLAMHDANKGGLATEYLALDTEDARAEMLINRLVNNEKIPAAVLEKLISGDVNASAGRAVLMAIDKLTQVDESQLVLDAKGFNAVIEDAIKEIVLRRRAWAGSEKRVWVNSLLALLQTQTPIYQQAYQQVIRALVDC